MPASEATARMHLRPDIRLVDPAVQAPPAWPREHQIEKDDKEQDRRIGTIERPVSHRYLGRCGQGGDAGVESNGDQHAAHHFDHSGTRAQPLSSGIGLLRVVWSMRVSARWPAAALNVDIVEGWIIGAAKDKTFAPAQKNLCQSQWQLALAAEASAGRSGNVRSLAEAE